MTRLPAHPDVDAALAALTGAGVTAVALTNSTRPVAQAQLEYAGLDGYFDRVMSADDVRRLQPAPEPYRAVAAAYDVPPPTSGWSPRTPGTSPGRSRRAAGPPLSPGRAPS